jgi:predicted AAA+ superfamily ATPase
MIDEILKARASIPRPLYTEKIKPFIDREILKVLTGQRRVGKSYPKIIFGVPKLFF